MKEKDARIDTDEHRIVLYVEREDGSYGGMQTGAYMVKNFFGDYQEKARQFEARCGERYRKGEISPVGYFIELFGLIQDSMAVPDVAARVGLSPAAVRKHMSAAGFERATVGQLRKYADVFGVPLQALLDPLAGQSRAQGAPQK